MTTYCRNGHRIGPAVRWDPGAGTPDRCMVCGALFSEYVPAEDVPRWPVVLVVLVALLVVGAWWWWMWLAPR